MTSVLVMVVRRRGGVKFDLRLLAINENLFTSSNTIIKIIHSALNSMFCNINIELLGRKLTDIICRCVVDTSIQGPDALSRFGVLGSVTIETSDLGLGVYSIEK